MPSPDRSIAGLASRGAVGAERRARGLRSRRARVGGVEMVYDQGGRQAAPVVVLLHGFSADKDVWVRFAARLTADYRVIVPDLLGHGGTPFVAGADYSAAAQAERVGGLLDALGVGPVHIMGNSMGGFVAASFAVAHPDRVRSLGLCDAAGVAPPRSSVLDRALAVGDNPFLIDDAAQFPAFYALTMARPPWLPGWLLRARANQYAALRDRLEHIWDSYYDRGLLDGRLGEITVPSLVMWGERDALIDVSAAGVWGAGLPRAEVITYPDLGHMPMLEDPKRTAAAYRDFLRRAVA